MARLIDFPQMHLLSCSSRLPLADDLPLAAAKVKVCEDEADDEADKENDDENDEPVRGVT